MKKADVKVGGTYKAKVTDKIVSVRLDREKGTGWSATNLVTGKTIYIKSAQRLRGPAPGQDATTTPKTAQDAKVAKPTALKTGKPKAATQAKQGDKKTKRTSAIDAAAKVLGGTKEPMTCRELIEAMATKGYWKSPNGKTPHATLYSAMLREINAKGKDARFKKTARGKFAIAGG
jgi:hypothetical protein